MYLKAKTIASRIIAAVKDFITLSAKGLLTYASALCK